METRINGEARQSYNTKEMIWSCLARFSSYLSRDFSFVPAMSSPAVLQQEPPRTCRRKRKALSAESVLKIGDVVELSSPRDRQTRNRIAAGVMKESDAI